MKFSLVAFSLILCSFTGISANTVMVSVQESRDKETAIFLSAVESGIMDVFFEAGHIVFNDTERDSGKNSGSQREILLAREGGADRLLKVVLRFKREAEVGGELETLTYVYMSLSDRRIIKEETLPPEIIEKDPKMPNEEFCTLLGKEIGKRILPER